MRIISIDGREGGGDVVHEVVFGVVDGLLPRDVTAEKLSLDPVVGDQNTVAG